MLTAAQDQALRTFAVKRGLASRFLAQNVGSVTAANSAGESVNHIVCQFTVLAKREYTGDDRRKLSIGVCAENMAWNVLTRTNCMSTLWDFRIETDHHVEHNRPDLVVLAKQQATRILPNN